VYLLLELIEEQPASCDTADGRPATRPFAHARLARMRCDDVHGCSYDEAVGIARGIKRKQRDSLAAQARRVAAAFPSVPHSVIVAGSGEFLARDVAERALPRSRIVSLRDHLSADTSSAACAHAVAVLAAGDAALHGER
jgi:uncharacterized hydantoinase/oxoprolinase family protein